MRSHLRHKKLSAACVSSLLLITAVEVSADKRIDLNEPRFVSQSTLDALNASNKAFETKQENVIDNRFKAKQSGQQKVKKNHQSERYVTPETIELLNWQEAQFYAEQKSRPDTYLEPYTQLPQVNQDLPGYVAFPPYGSGYDMSSSPWGSNPNLIHQGNELTWVPNAAVDGVAPITTTPIINHNGDFSGSTPSPNMIDGKIFNPYTFLNKED